MQCFHNNTLCHTLLACRKLKFLSVTITFVLGLKFGGSEYPWIGSATDRRTPLRPAKKRLTDRLTGHSIQLFQQVFRNVCSNKYTGDRRRGGRSVGRSVGRSSVNHAPPALPDCLPPISPPNGAVMCGVVRCGHREAQDVTDKCDPSPDEPTSERTNERTKE